MRGTLSNFLAWGRLTFGTRGFPILVVLLVLGAPIAVIACGDTGPSPVGDAPDADAGTDQPATGGGGGGGDAGDDAAAAGDDAGDDAGKKEVLDAGKDAGDAGDADAEVH